MDDKELINEIAKSFSVPTPQQKEAFLEDHQYFLRASRKKIILSQIGYINKALWLSSIFVFIVGLILVQKDVYDAMSVVSILMPFISGIGIVITFRSMIYKMQEIEAASLISTRGVIFARTLIIGISHLILIIALTLVMFLYGKKDFFVTGCLILIPYLLTSAICLELERKHFVRTKPWFCFAVSAGVSFFVLLIQNFLIIDTSEFMRVGIVIVAAILILANAWEFRNMFKAEENVWNFV